MYLGIGITATLAAYYAYLNLRLLYSWKKNVQICENAKVQIPGFSIIIPFRNELNNLPQIIKSLKSLELPHDHFEIIFVNDHSTDGGVEYIKKNAPEGTRILDMALKSKGKKIAVHKGILKSKYDIIVCVDADVTFGSKWIVSLLSHFVENRLRFLAGPVSLMSTNNKSFLEYFQEIEFSGLMLFTGAGLFNKTLISANGANMVFDKSTYFQIDGMKSHLNLASGDDVFTVQNIYKHYPNDISFLKSKDAIVYTSSLSDFNQFLNQRVRWSGKSTAYSHGSTKWFLFYNFLFHLSIPILPIVFRSWEMLVFLLSIKLYVDWQILAESTKFFQKEMGVINFLKISFFQLFYMIIVGILSIIKPTYEWKNREVR